jgi:hypothetical protein
MIKTYPVREESVLKHGLPKRTSAEDVEDLKERINNRRKVFNVPDQKQSRFAKLPFLHEQSLLA